jgi:hypothetical protein
MTKLEKLEKAVLALGNHPWSVIDEENQSVKVFYNCGCHKNLLDPQYQVEAIPEFQAVLDKFDAWHENDNAEALTIRFNK